VWADVSHAERDRFSAAFEAHAAHLHDYCGSLLAERQDVADAAQATLVIAYALLDRLHDVGRMRAWLLTLARRVCLSEKPVWSRRSGTPAADEPETEKLGHRFSTGRHSAAATLSSLPTAEREVLDLVYRHYLSSADVAAVLGVPADGASALLREAVRSFERAHADQAIEATSNALVVGVRAISAIPLAELPTSILPGAISMALDPTLAIDSAGLAFAVGELGADGFPVPPLPPVPRKVTWERATRVPHPRLALLSILVLALGATIALMASSSSGMPNPGEHVIGQSLSQHPVGGLIRRPGSLPITALLPKKQHHEIVLPMLPVMLAAPRPTPSPKPHPASSPSATTPTPTPSPTPTSPSPTPTSPSPTPATTP
jgi:DNA-directed RNA polymerase specialized sigma24 family protein